MMYTRLPPNFYAHLKYSLETKKEEEKQVEFVAEHEKNALVRRLTNGNEKQIWEQIGRISIKVIWPKTTFISF